MAKYIEVQQLGMFTYALDECEDYLTLDAYMNIKASGKFENTKYLSIFEYYHLQEGGTLNDNILLKLNGSLRQLGRPSLIFVNGHTTSFANLRGQEKVTRRQAILEHLRSLSPMKREELIQVKRTAASRLPERDSNLPNRAPADEGSLSRQEVERRRKALAKAQQADARQDMPVTNDLARESPTDTSHLDRGFVPESTVQDNVVELIAEMQELKSEVASLKGLLQTIFRNV